MTPAARPPLRLPPLSLVVIPLLIAIVSFSPDRFLPFAVTGQAFGLIVVLRFFCYWPPMVRWVSSMPVPHRTIFALLVGGMILGHYTLESRKYFPFITWCIFPSVREVDPVTCREFIATTAGGRQVRLLAEQLLPSIVQINPLDGFTPEQTDRLAHALAQVYNELHPGDPVQQIDLVVQAVQLHPSANESRSEPSCELLKHYDISSDRWN